jgi:exosortase
MGEGRWLGLEGMMIGTPGLGGSGGFGVRAVLLGLLGAVLAWAFWPALGMMGQKWSRDPHYAHGLLVPLFAACLLRHRWPQARRDRFAPSDWGLACLGLGSLFQLAGAWLYVDWVGAMALLPDLAGVCLLAGGFAALRWAWPAIAFLVFMIPLPYRVERALGSPLQQLATLASTFTLQTIGLPAVAEGNVIVLDEARIGVVEACNGLGILFTFFAMATGLVLVIQRSLLEKVLIILSAFPIAIVANVARITLTGFLHQVAGGRVADMVYHDLAGWLMMPFALAMLWLELEVLSLIMKSDPGGETFRPLAGGGADPRPTSMEMVP